MDSIHLYSFPVRIAAPHTCAREVRRDLQIRSAIISNSCDWLDNE
jgi:hypothetical protein